jgi:hypothetical protein
MRDSCVKNLGDGAGKPTQHLPSPDAATAPKLTGIFLVHFFVPFFSAFKFVFYNHYQIVFQHKINRLPLLQQLNTTSPSQSWPMELIKRSRTSVSRCVQNIFPLLTAAQLRDRSNPTTMRWLIHSTT